MYELCSYCSLRSTRREEGDLRSPDIRNALKDIGIETRATGILLSSRNGPPSPNGEANAGWIKAIQREYYLAVCEVCGEEFAAEKGMFPPPHNIKAPTKSAGEQSTTYSEAVEIFQKLKDPNTSQTEKTELQARIDKALNSGCPYRRANIFKAGAGD